MFFISTEVLANTWQQEKSDHFLIEYLGRQNYSWSRDVLRNAESYYDKICLQLNHSKYDSFWTWDNRVKIVIYPDQDTFVKETHQPAWSRGGAVVDHRFTTGLIITFKQENGFIESVLPHEISHLVLNDFIGKEHSLPLWFDEGVAQYQEADKGQEALQAMRSLSRNGKYFSIKDLSNVDIRRETDPVKVAIFYAQSVSIVDFLIIKYGNIRFSELCRFVREGEDFYNAFQKAYKSLIDSPTELEIKWLEYTQS